MRWETPALRPTPHGPLNVNQATATNPKTDAPPPVAAGDVGRCSRRGDALGLRHRPAPRHACELSLAFPPSLLPSPPPSSPTCCPYWGAAVGDDPGLVARGAWAHHGAAGFSCAGRRLPGHWRPRHHCGAHGVVLFYIFHMTWALILFDFDHFLPRIAIARRLDLAGPRPMSTPASAMTSTFLWWPCVSHADRCLQSDTCLARWVDRRRCARVDIHLPGPLQVYGDGRWELSDGAMTWTSFGPHFF